MSKSITIDYIKKLVEIHTEIEDLSINTKRRNVIESRSIYYKLCRLFLDKKYNTYKEIGDLVGKDHSTVIYGVKMFDDLENTLSFSHYKKVYNFCFNHLSSIDNGKSIDYDLKIATELIDSLRENIKIEVKNNIENNKRIKYLEGKLHEQSKANISDVLVKLSKLDYADTLDFELRANAFLSMNRIKTKYEHLNN